MGEPMASLIAFERPYSDGSGIEYAVRLTDWKGEPRIEFEAVETVAFPAEKVDWLIACLSRIRDERARALEESDEG